MKKTIRLEVSQSEAYEAIKRYAKDQLGVELPGDPNAIRTAETSDNSIIIEWDIE